MSYEHQSVAPHEHELHGHEVHDLHAEHAHDVHVCSATCEHHQAAQHIDFMEPVERQDHSHEAHDHVHEPGCGHVGYEEAHHQVDHGKEKSHFHDPQEKHVHGPDCGHMEYQHVHTEIDKPHVHDEHCGHLDHNKAAEHVDHGKDHSHDEHTDHFHEEKHIHGPNCGHVEYEEAHKHVDTHVDEPDIAETAVEHAAGGDAEVSTSGDSHKVEAAARQTEEVAKAQQQTEIKAAMESKATSAQEVSTTAETGSELKTASPKMSETSNAVPIDEAVLARLNEQAAVDADKVTDETEPTTAATQMIEQVSSEEQPPIEIPLTFNDEVSSLELDSESLLIDEHFEAGDETLTDFASVEGSDVLDLMYESEALPLDFREGVSPDMGGDFEAFEGDPSLNLAEDSTVEGVTDSSTGEGLTQESWSAPDSAPAEQQVDFSNFGNGQIAEVYNVEWPVLAEVGSDELESRLDTTRTYIAHFMEQANEIDPSDLEAMSNQLIAMLQNMPKESAEELLPLLEELTELYELPQLERLLELYFAGHYQDQNMFTRIFGSAAQDSQDITVRIGQAVLELLKSTNKQLQRSAA